MADETTETTEAAQTTEAAEAAKETTDAADKVAETEKTTETKAAETQADWRGSLPDDLKSHAERFASVEDVLRGHIDVRKQLSSAVVPPGKDAGDKEIAAYHKKIGVPETPEAYVFEMPEGRDATEDELAFQKAVAQKFHGLSIPADKAAELNTWWNDMIVANDQAQIDADKKFAAEAETDLKKQWGADYDKNRAYADRAATVMFGDKLDEVRHLETKDGRYMLDHPALLRAMATVGREMAEGGLVPPLSEGDRNEANDQIEAIQKKIDAAQSQNDNVEANRLYQEKLALITKRDGNQGIVGARGRVA